MDSKQQIVLLLSLTIIINTISTNSLPTKAGQPYSTGCNRTCGSNQVPFPFGFSSGCPIPLNCTQDGLVFINEFPVQAKSISILGKLKISVEPKCQRPFQVLEGLYTDNYAPTNRNAILFHDCISPRTCNLPSINIETRFQSLNCSINSNISCASDDTQDPFFDYRSYINSSHRQYLLSSIAAESFDDRAPGASLDIEVMELEWWLPGEDCGCDRGADCTRLNTPTGKGFRCVCRDGMVGDGYLAGEGCRKGLSYNSRIKAGIGASVSGLGVVILVICCLLWRKMLSSYPIFRLKKKTEEDRSIESFLSKHGPLTIKRYRYSEIKKITESFRDKLGEGGYGGVFKGKLPDGRLVAVKLLKESKPSGEEFANEVASIGRTSHVNIVTLLGFCFEGSKRALIYEFMPNGSLEKYIQQGPSQLDHQLGWETLYQIAIGIAQGLEYLHKGCKTRILHFDIKPHNILLDENLCPKISDFGLAKICPQRESIISMVGARGTAGYIAPEVFCRNFGGVSHKSDVYSYGMMVLEMVGGRKNISEQVNNSSEKYFPDWIYKRLELGEELGVHQIRNEDESQLARRMIIVSLWCIQTKPADRPPMSRVIEMLQGSFQPLIIPPRPILSSPPRSPKRSDPSTSSTSTTDS